MTTYRITTTTVNYSDLTHKFGINDDVILIKGQLIIDTNAYCRRITLKSGTQLTIGEAPADANVWLSILILIDQGATIDGYGSLIYRGTEGNSLDAINILDVDSLLDAPNLLDTGKLL